MLLTPRHSRFSLARNQAAKLSRARDTNVRCVDGVAWITVDGDPRDIVLERGQSFVVDSNADVIVFALRGPAAVELDAPGARETPARQPVRLAFAAA
jgi:hypothetical protein